MKRMLPFLLACFAIAQAHAATSMVGACNMREADIWLKLDGSDISEISAFCAPASNPEAKIKGYFSRKPDEHFANTAQLAFGPLAPGTEYKYTVLRGAETIAGGSFKTKPDYLDRTPPPDFSFAVLGENHVNDKDYDPPFRTPGGDYEIYQTVKSKNPAFLIWAANANTLRPADADSRIGIFSRYAQARETLNAIPLFISVPNYGVMGSSSYGKPDSDKHMSNRRDSVEAFNANWANPSGPFEDLGAYSFTYSDAEIFVLDDCSDRSNLDYKVEKNVFLGERQIEWLMNGLANSSAKFKIIVMNSPVANPATSKENFASAEIERKRLLDFLIQKKIGGLIIVSANKPYGEVTRLVRAGAYPLVDITTGPLTGRPAKEVTEMNYFRMPSSAQLGRSFAMIKIDGAENARAATITFYNPKGEAKFTVSIPEEELYKFE